MSVELKITDPHLMSHDALAGVLAFLQASMKPQEKEPETPAVSSTDFQETRFAAFDDTPRRFVPPVNDAALTCDVDLAFDPAVVFAAGALVVPPPPPPPAVEVTPVVEAAAPSVTLPPPPSPAMPLPSGPTALQAAFGMHAPTSTDAATAPTAVTAPTAALAPSADVKGLPWDPRIHASTKGQNKDGSWKRKKNTTDDLVATVEAELRAVNGIPIPPPPGAPPEPGDPTTPPTFFAWCVSKMAKGALTQSVILETLKVHGVAGLHALNARPDLVGTLHAALVARTTA